MSLDQLDRRILEMLRQNCLLPFVEVARKLNVAEGTIRYRVKRLLHSGVIQRFTAQVDPKKVGFGILAFALINVIPGQLQTAASALSQIPKVIEVHEIHTYGDLLVKIRAEDLNQLGKIVANQIKIVPGVLGSQVISVLNSWKEEM